MEPKNDLTSNDTPKIRKKRVDTKLRKTTKEYTETYKQKHKDKLKVDCDICGGKMTLFNESHHRSTMRHQKAIELNDLKEENRLLKQDLIRDLVERINLK
jgi:hypothetical protein